jgi:hydroxypyruvate isomerase|tara:strand:- start:226104 stop:226922 length:819 start_codon:yes stop_codon:yes gene_type:complete
MPLRLAGHLGVRAPDQPLFAKSAAAIDPLTQIAAMAEYGLAGVFDNFLTLRPPEVQSAMGEGLSARGMAMGSFVHDPLRWDQPCWSSGEALHALPASLEAARRSGSRTINCVTGLDRGRGRPEQLRAMAENLARAADRAAPSDIMLCVETTHAAYAPGALIDSIADAKGVVSAAAHPGVRLNVDVAHLAMHGIDPAGAILENPSVLGMVQIADLPGRVEPGAGSASLDWAAIIAALGEAEYSGLVELELEPAEPGAAGERAMLSRLTRLGLL